MAFNASKRSYEAPQDQYTPADSTAHSYLGKTLKIKGEITSDEYLTVEGEVTGNINITKTLTIGKSGYVDGEITADVVKIDGRAKGNIKAHEKLQITSNGTFTGNVSSNKLVIQEGAVFQGKANQDE